MTHQENETPATAGTVNRGGVSLLERLLGNATTAVTIPSTAAVSVVEDTKHEISFGSKTSNVISWPFSTIESLAEVIDRLDGSWDGNAELQEKLGTTDTVVCGSSYEKKIYAGQHINRTGQNWLYGSFVGVDLDTRDGQPLTADERHKIEDRFRAMGVPGSVAYTTPKGLRLFFALRAPCADRDLYLRAIHGAWEISLEAFKGMERLKIDETCKDLARCFYAPKAFTKGARRDAETFVVGGWYDVEELAARAPATPASTPRKTNTPTKNVNTAAIVEHLVSCWPSVGKRHDAFRALCGVLLSRGVDTETTETIVRGVCEGTDSTATETHVALVARTDALIEAGEPCQGVPALSRIIGPAAIENLLALLPDEVLTEIELARRFTERYSDDLRYCAEHGCWYSWESHRWALDRTVAVFDLARAIVKEAAKGQPSAEVKRLEKAATIAAVERIARSHREHAVRSEAFDRDLWALNTPDRAIDLRKKDEAKPHERSALHTKSTAVAPGGDCPRWLQFLDEATGGNKQLQAYLQRIAGYALTGDTSEHALFFFWGPGGNGKGVFLNTLRGVLGDYAQTAPMETFVEARGERHPTDLADLRGARLVVAQETEEGRHWAESRIKALTGGDPIKARLMRQDFFEFQPQFKLLIAANNKPGFRSVDAAIRRRLHLITFDQTPKKVDRQLSEKLRAEWPGILKWAIEGCLAWQQQGLDPPESVRAATDSYLDEQDLLARCLEDSGYEKGEPEAGEQYPEVKTLWSDWQMWALQNGVSRGDTGDKRRFGDRLEAAGFARAKKNGKRVHLGLRRRGENSGSGSNSEMLSALLQGGKTS